MKLTETKHGKHVDVIIKSLRFVKRRVSIIFIEPHNNTTAEFFNNSGTAKTSTHLHENGQFQNFNVY